LNAIDEEILRAAGLKSLFFASKMDTKFVGVMKFF
jgi:hypothetical protein